MVTDLKTEQSEKGDTGSTFLRERLGLAQVHLFENEGCPGIFNTSLAEAAKKAMGRYWISLITKRSIAEDEPVLGDLLDRVPQFYANDEGTLSSTGFVIAKAFQADQVGVIVLAEELHALMGLKINTFAGIQLGEIIYRLLSSTFKGDIESFENVLNLISLNSMVRSIEGTTVIAQEFVYDGETPTTISQEEYDSWIERLRSSRLVFEVDIGDNDIKLDNLLRINGGLYWCDGNIARARFGSDEEVEEFIKKMETKLKRFIW